MPSFFKDPSIKGVLCLHTDLTVTGVRRVATLHTQPTVQICQTDWLEFTCNSGSPPRTLNWVTTSSFFHRTNYLTMGFLHGLVKPADHRHHAGLSVTLCQHLLQSRGVQSFPCPRGPPSSTVYSQS